MLGFKKKISRDDAADLFMAHCRNQAALLEIQMADHLRAYCDGQDDRPSLDAVISRPLVSYAAGKISDNSLLRAHCYALALAAGLNSVPRSVAPQSQVNVTLWKVSKLIAEEDVGVENAGHSPSPWPRSGLHVQYAPGTLVGGVPSLQVGLVNRYQKLRDTRSRVALFLTVLRVLRPLAGVAKPIFERVELTAGLIGLNKKGYLEPCSDELDEWEADLEIFDVAAALNPLPAALVDLIGKSIGDIDPFWPRFCRQNRLTWR